MVAAAVAGTAAVGTARAGCTVFGASTTGAATTDTLGVTTFDSTFEAAGAWVAAVESVCASVVRAGGSVDGAAEAAGDAALSVGRDRFDRPPGRDGVVAADASVPAVDPALLELVVLLEFSS